MDKMKNKYFSFFLAGLFIGGMFGIILINILVSYRVDNYIREIKYLNSIIEEDTVKLEKFQKSKRNRILVKKVEIEVIFPKQTDKNDITKIALEKNIKHKYNNILGKEVESVDGEMLCEVIDNRIMKIDDKEYKLKVKKILISSVIKIWVEAKKG
ncbi:hypothetical protein ADU90_11210 [Clostridium botulinum]|uniref:Sporulation membrane protein YtrI C-terminal domain-containing protein n=1 Tax=Clostridium botulinum C/D str. DC5 TaxID=1443128 RepID=A0A0A0IE31_CLOBO|nr:hypothetical protein [Clostridium botulinum]KEI01139.1 hypothetical protein Z952_12940 [Clostridium botulinum C/D str. BKT75002]KEI13382.1 hypothetical protein Z954_07970 [Clostridium botulinum C/D str. BKT2873]KGM93213.1 hypothetical protein Z956_12160 [Clostridium botulinum D str. CCUG 7971]KGM98733.1 hypothetical protein Z955_10715 [Clostridium botulinum C/D str. DC5]KOC50797.1 hypothetical protein ADU88_01615 [Clostridium botulinum]